MSRTQWWLLAFLAFSSLIFRTVGSPLQVMSAPNLFRVGTAENVFVECQDCSGADQIVRISVMTHLNTMLASTTVTLTSASNFQGFGQITIPAENFKKDPDVKQYVNLQAQFPDRMLEKVVLVSFQSGYIFIQTDKTIYTPNSRVLFRLFAVTPSMMALPNDHLAGINPCTEVEIMNSEGKIFPHDKISLNMGTYSGAYTLDQNASPGLWKVVTKFCSNPQMSFSADFQVKEYVLPTFKVKLTPTNSFLYMDSPQLTINIKATYLFGREVEGTAYVVFGVVYQGQKRDIPSSIQRVQVKNGNGMAQLTRQHIAETFPNINSLLGSSTYAVVSVLTEDGDEMVTAELSGMLITNSPYKIRFRKTPEYFKPGVTFEFEVEVVNPDETPAQGVEVVVNPGAIQSQTAVNGRAGISINVGSTASRLTISARTNSPGIPQGRQAVATMQALRHATRSNNNIHISVNEKEAQLGAHMKIHFIFTGDSNSVNHLTYLILSRGQLVKYGSYTKSQEVLISTIILVTKEMMPSFRIIAYYHTNDNEVISDSVWVDVEDSCMGSLNLELLTPASLIKPRGTFTVKITGDPGASVGLLAVDKGTEVLGNKNLLTQKKIWDIVEKLDTGCTPGGGQNSMGVFYDAGLLFVSSAGSETPHRKDSRCPSSTRRKRESTTQDGTISSSEFDMDEVVSRTAFPESWLWSMIQFPPCPSFLPNCESTSLEKHFNLKDSITSWQLIGISLSRTSGICVSRPLEVIVRKEFFIDLKLPYAAVQGEQLNIKAVVHNLRSEPAIVHVNFAEDMNFCSFAFRRGAYSQEVKVGPYATQSVNFVIIPMKVGQFEVEVKATVRDSSLNDGIRKTLLVKPAGVLTKLTQVITLDPSKQGGVQEETVKSEIPLTDVVPNSPMSTVFYLHGEEQMKLTDIVSGESMGNQWATLQPTGPGDNNMIIVTMPVIATVYLDKTNQWETVGFHKRKAAIQHIKTGYENMLSFRKNDGSFGSFSAFPSSTWLTAYFAKVFSMASPLLPISTDSVCEAIKFLILTTQQPDGMFKEVGRLVHLEMTGLVSGSDSDASMTAFCLIAMQESRKMCLETVYSLPSSINKAVTYLEKRLPSLTNPCAVAITSYALANENKLNQATLFAFSSADLTHWPSPQGHPFTLEATAYALLALVKAKAFEKAIPIVKWIKQQQHINGGYGSTQATMMVYQALAEYWVSASEDAFLLNVDISLPGRLAPYKFYFTKDNAHLTQTSQHHAINQVASVRATGTGTATLTMISTYYALPNEVEISCTRFDLSVQIIPVNINEEMKTYKLKIDLLYKDTQHDSTMSVLDINLPPGFTANSNDLDLLSRQKDCSISKYQRDTVLSGSVIIYLDKVSHTQSEELTFRIHQTLKVGALQPAAVSVYEYYDQTHCVKFYHPERRDGELLMLCAKFDCRCAEESCGVQKKGKVDNEQRMAKSCERTINFAYKVKLESSIGDISTNQNIMRVLDVIKEGSVDVYLQGKTRVFLSPPHCRESLDLRPGSDYLIMGASRDIQRGNTRDTYQYVLGETTWIEYWPTEEECQIDKYRFACLGLADMLEQHMLFGCVN
ncbi:complement C3-like [Echeneis naucrates]|uniref:complement C3-like n=1 Tax=Echeneis naucrates TaxID=173247 RepID=UPI001113B0B5|nr:complement C3-like [Echeneis naucrates]